MGIPHVDVFLFVGVAAAWAIYLIPKAIQHHEQAEHTRTVDRFSHRLRVLARREPVSPRDAELVVSGAKVSAAAAPAAPASTATRVAERPVPGASPSETRALERRRREASRLATKRRRRVLGVLLVALASVAGVATYGLITWWYAALPGGLLLAWLVACRVMVKGERSVRRAAARDQDETGQGAESPTGETPLAMDDTTEIARVVHAEPGMWDPVPVTLPTYVDKPAAARSVRGIDLESDGVWTSGRTAADSAIARQADAEAAAARSARESDDSRRAAGAAG